MGRSMLFEAHHADGFVRAPVLTREGSERTPPFQERLDMRKTLFRPINTEHYRTRSGCAPHPRILCAARKNRSDKEEMRMKKLFIMLTLTAFIVGAVFAVNASAPAGDKVNCCVKGVCKQVSKADCAKAGGRVVKDCKECKAAPKGSGSK
jgi:hypothetical protein